MDKKKELRRRLKAKIQNSQNLRSGHTTREQIFREQMSRSVPSGNDLSGLSGLPGNSLSGLSGLPGNDPSISDVLSNLMSLSDSKNKGKAMKKAKKNLNNIVKNQLVNNIVESAAKTNPVNEIPVTVVDKVLLDGLDVSDDESVSSNLSD